MDTTALLAVDWTQWEKDYSEKVVPAYQFDYEEWAKEPHDQRQEHYDSVWGYVDPRAEEARAFHEAESAMEDAIYRQESDAHDKATAYSTISVLGDEPVESEWHDTFVYEDYADSEFQEEVVGEDGVVEDIPF